MNIKSSIEGHPTTAESICMMWGTVPCIDFINNLLFDDGGSQSFDFDTIMELSFLSDLLSEQFNTIADKSCVVDESDSMILKLKEEQRNSLWSIK